ncbi:MAG: ribosome recycling factor [Actinobacteria bacterium]|nr:ribosome recycling factor [Actinomycetota bacterium]
MVDKILNEAESKMKKAILAVSSEFSTVRTGRASPALLDRIMVDYYGTPTPLNQLATVSVPEARLLTIQPWDKSSMENVEKAILQSDLGLTPSNDGTIIRLPIPHLNEERRKELAKVIKGIAEEGRVAIRNIRRDANEHLKALEKKHEISEDDLRRFQEKVQKITDKYIEEIDAMLSNKDAEIKEV